MTDTTQLKSERVARILGDNDSGAVAAIHRRRKSAMTTLLGSFEELIQPLLPPGNEKAIQSFKGVCRRKINGLAYEGIRAAEAAPGDSVSDLAGDLAEQLAFNDNGGPEPT